MASQVFSLDGDTLNRDHSILGVRQSGLGKIWVKRDAKHDEATLERLSFSLAQTLGLSELTSRLLVARGVDVASAPAFLSPRLRDCMPDPECIIDMRTAATCLAEVVTKQGKIGILGDYDVDGGCGTAMLAETLRALGCQVHTHIPDRLIEGYGPNIPAIEALLSRGAELVICVDCGTAAIDILNAFNGRVPMMVLDHHKPDGFQLPRAIVVNPNRLDCTSGLGDLCATGVVFMTLIALLRELTRGAFFENRPQPNMLSKLDLVALATICDVMPLTGLNRAFVAQGLKILAQGSRLGLATLASTAGVDQPGTVTACGYFLGPRLNAGGRIAKAALGLELLLTQDVNTARRLAEELNDVNNKRRDVEASVLLAATEQAEAQIANGAKILFVYGNSWHIGVVGIVAGRLKERFQCPVFVGAMHDGLIKGSARSVTGFDVGLCVISARHNGILLSGGGHAMAAGFSLAEGDVAAFQDALLQNFKQQADLPISTSLAIDAVVALRAVTPSLAKEIGALAPFGAGNDEPILAISRLRCVKSDRIGRDGATLRVVLQDEYSNRLKGLVFRAADKGFATLLEDRSLPLLHVAGHLKCDLWQGRENLTFFICDVALVGA